MAVRRAIRLADARGREATVLLLTSPIREVRFFTDLAGQRLQVARRIKGSPKTHPSRLVERYPDPDALARALIQGDPEVDLEHAGRETGPCDRVFLNAEGAPLFNPAYQEIRTDAHGVQVARRPWQPRSANLVPAAAPVWSHRYVSRAEAIRKMIFARVYQVAPTNTLEFDFLFGIAQHLQERGTMVQVGSGTNGRGPLVFRRGGRAYRAYLDGRTRGEAMRLLLYLKGFHLRMQRVEP